MPREEVKEDGGKGEQGGNEPRAVDGAEARVVRGKGQQAEEGERDEALHDQAEFIGPDEEVEAD